MPDPAAPGLSFRSLAGGFLVQTRDVGRVAREALKVVTQRAPTEAELDDLLFAFRVCKHVKSNAIVYAKDRRDRGHRRRPDEPRRFRAHRRLEGEEAAKAAGLPAPLHAGQRRRLRRVLPVRRRARSSDRRGRDGGDPARRLDARRRGDRRRRRRRDRHGASPACATSATDHKRARRANGAGRSTNIDRLRRRDGPRSGRAASAGGSRRAGET